MTRRGPDAKHEQQAAVWPTTAWNSRQWLKRPLLRSAAVLLGTSFVVGCSITGTWQTVSIEPPGAPFPVEHVTFREDRRYTATGATRINERRSRQTTTGHYEWNGFSLKIVQPGCQPRVYRARRQFDGTLRLTYKEGSAEVTATLERQDRSATSEYQNRDESK